MYGNNLCAVYIVGVHVFNFLARGEVFSDTVKKKNFSYPHHMEQISTVVITVQTLTRMHPIEVETCAIRLHDLKFSL